MIVITLLATFMDEHYLFHAPIINDYYKKSKLLFRASLLKRISFEYRNTVGWAMSHFCQKGTWGRSCNKIPAAVCLTFWQMIELTLLDILRRPSWQRVNTANQQPNGDQFQVQLWHLLHFKIWRIVRFNFINPWIILKSININEDNWVPKTHNIYRTRATITRSWILTIHKAKGHST